jgi:hypothetical protein
MYGKRMSRELNKKFYQIVIADTTFKNVTGANTTDPRLYKMKTPIKLAISDTKSAYAVYRPMGTTKLSSSAKIDIGQLDDKTYSLEVFGKKDTDVEDICEAVRDLFYESNFFTDNLKVGYTWATEGSCDFDEGRQLYLETMTIYFTKIIKLVS